MGEPEPGEVTRLLVSWGSGDKGALDRLSPLVYGELRRLARGYLKRERRGYTLQPTAPVHEVYLRLVDANQIQCRGRAQFFGIAANLMRQILVNHAKRHQASKRGGGKNLPLVDGTVLTGGPDLDLLALDQALNRMARLDPRHGQIVELRFFGGLTEEEIADLMGVSPRTVNREWRIARMSLHNQLSHDSLRE